MKTQRDSRINIIDVMEQWARYRHGRITGGNGWQKQVLLGKLMDGMPGTNCPKCRGSGKVPVPISDNGIAMAKVDCPICDGAGKVPLTPSQIKVNPALIASTWNRGQYNDDPQSQRVDWLVCTAITEDERLIVLSEFSENGNRNRKISRLRITHSMFNELLDSALGKIEANLNG